METIEHYFQEALATASLNDNVISVEELKELVPDEAIREQVINLLKKANVDVNEDEDNMLEKEDEKLDDIITESFSRSSEYQFLKELSCHRRLTTEEERRLFENVKSGRNAQEAIKSPDLNDHEKECLQRIIKRGSDAREKIILSYNRYVLNIAFRYNNARGKIPFLDIVQCGFLGLLTAFDQFDITKEFKLATFAKFKVMNAIQEQIASLRNPIAVPKSAQYQRSKIMKYIEQYRNEHGEDPDNIDIAFNALGAKTEEEAKRMATRTIPNLIDSSKPTVNMDQKIKNENSTENDNTFAHFIPDEAKDPLKALEDEEKHKILYESLQKYLNDREIYIIYRRFGLGKYKGQSITLEKLGEQLQMTRERARQIQDEALKKLRDCPNADLLRSILS